MRLLTIFLHILSTSLLLSLLNLSSTCLLASATPIAQRQGLDTGDVHEALRNTKQLLRKPGPGSLIWAKGIDMKSTTATTGWLKRSRTVIKSHYTAMCAMLVTGEKDGMFYGIVFAESPKDVLSKELLFGKSAYAPLIKALKTGVGEEFEVFAGWGRVSGGKLERNGDGSFKQEKPLDFGIMQQLHTTFENLLRKETSTGLRWRVGKKMEK